MKNHRINIGIERKVPVTGEIQPAGCICTVENALYRLRCGRQGHLTEGEPVVPFLETLAHDLGWYRLRIDAESQTLQVVLDA